MTSEDEQAHGRFGEHQVGSVGEEAAKLLGALSGWARTHGSDVGHGLSDVAADVAATFREVDEHLATGSAECRYCPICRVVHAVREGSPEVRTHLTVAGMSLMQAATAFLATTLPEDADRWHSEGVEHIDLDDEWPEGE